MKGDETILPQAWVAASSSTDPSCLVQPRPPRVQTPTVHPPQVRARAPMVKEHHPGPSTCPCACQSTQVEEGVWW